MEKYLTLIIVTPEKPILEEKVTSVVLPASKGEMGVLPGHIPYVAQLEEGILRYTASNSKGEFAIMGGFAQVVDNTVSVFAESAQLATEINAEVERQKIQKLKDVIALKDKTMDVEAAQASLKESLVRMRLLDRQYKQKRKKSL